MKTKKRSTLRAQADTAFSKAVRAIGFCQASSWNDGVKCGGILQCAHIIGRANYHLRWNPVNALCLCAGHHTWYTNHPFEWFEAISRRYPNRYEYLRAQQTQHWDKDYDKVMGCIAQFRQIVEGVKIRDWATSSDPIWDQCNPTSDTR